MIPKYKLKINSFGPKDLDVVFLISLMLKCSIYDVDNEIYYNLPYTIQREFSYHEAQYFKDELNHLKADVDILKV